MNVTEAATALAATSDSRVLPEIEQKHEQAMRLVGQARAAIAVGKLQRAKDLVSQAESLNASYGPSDDCPILVREDIAWLSGGRDSSSVVVQEHKLGKSSMPVLEMRDQDPVEAVRTAILPTVSEVLPLVDDSEPATRKMVKPVAFENVYRFELADVEPAAETSNEPLLNGVPCRQCGKVHAAATPNQHRFAGDSESVQQTRKRKVLAPKGARRSNRRMLEDSDDSTEADAIWDTPAFSWSKDDDAQNEPSTLHRLSSAFRRLGRPATE